MVDGRMVDGRGGCGNSLDIPISARRNPTCPHCLTDRSNLVQMTIYVLTQWPRHTYFCIVVIIVAGAKMREREMKLHSRITETQRRGVTSYD